MLRLSGRTIAAGAVTAALAVIAPLMGAAVLAAPITFVTALPVAEDQEVTRFQNVSDIFTRDPTALNRDEANVQFPSVFAYGPTSTLALFGTVNQGVNFMNETIAGGRQYRETSGFGDTLFFARYTLIHIDEPAETWRLAPLVGLYLPTGYYDKADHLGVLPDTLQNGSGSVDPYLGVAGTWKDLLQEVDFDATYRHDFAASPGFQFGDQARFDASWQFRILPWLMPEKGVPNYLMGVVETNVEWYGRNREAGVINNSTGGLIWFIDPGIYYGTAFWQFGAVVRIPIVQNLYGFGRLKETIGIWSFFEYYLTMPALPHWLRSGP